MSVSRQTDTQAHAIANDLVANNNNYKTLTHLALYYLMNYFLFAEIIEYRTIIIESALDVPDDKIQQTTMTEHFDIVTNDKSSQNTFFNVQTD